MLAARTRMRQSLHTSRGARSLSSGGQLEHARELPDARVASAERRCTVVKLDLRVTCSSTTPLPCTDYGGAAVAAPDKKRLVETAEITASECDLNACGLVSIDLTLWLTHFSGNAC